MNLSEAGHPHEALELLVEGRPSPGEERMLRDHLAACPRCTEELAFALRLRKAVETLPTLSREREDGMRRRVEARLDSPVSVPVPLLAAAAAAALLLWLGVNQAGPSRWLATRPAGELKGTVTPQSVPAEIREEVGKLSGLAAADTGNLAGLMVADFEKVTDLSGVTVAGGVQPALADRAFWGNRALRLERGGEADSPVEVIFPIAAAGPGIRAVAVTCWAFCESAPAVIGLAVETADGRKTELARLRKVAPGRWMWAGFELPEGEAGGAVPSALRVRVEGTGPVLLDRVELWLGSGGER